MEIYVSLFLWKPAEVNTGTGSELSENTSTNIERMRPSDTVLARCIIYKPRLEIMKRRFWLSEIFINGRRKERLIIISVVLASAAQYLENKCVFTVL